MFRRFFQQKKQGQTPNPQEAEQAGFTDAPDSEDIGLMMGRLMQKYTGTYVFSEQGRAEIHRSLPRLRQTYLALSHEQAHEKEAIAGFLYATALRKVGSFEEAAAIARTLPATYQTLISLAMAESALGNFDASVDAYRRAQTIQPKNVASLNDLGNLFLTHGKLAEALACYKESVQIDLSDPCGDAFAYIAYLHYLLAPTEEEWVENLKKLAHSQRPAQKLLNFLKVSYIGTLPHQGEALLNLARGVKADSATGKFVFRRGSKFDVGSTSLESPSATLAVKLMMELHGVFFSHSVSDVLSPDPRKPLRPVEYQIWRYKSFEPIPNVAPPDPAIAQSIAELAQTPYGLERWYALAQPLGQRLGPDALMSLLGVMVHPPAVSEGWTEWDWLTAVQIASALTIASLENAWEGSRRKAALTSLIYGPMDWSGAAALMAMAVLARQDMRICLEFDRICCDLWHFGRGSAEWPHELAMILGLRFVGMYSEEAGGHINAYFEQLRKEQEG